KAGRCRARSGWTCFGRSAIDMTRALLITQPAAARTDACAVTAIRDTLRRGGWSVDVLATAQAGDARRFAQEGRTQGFDVLVCYGGDGTAMQIAAGAVGSGIPLGLVPGGTGNLLAGNLRLPRSPAAAARAILKGKPLPIDLGTVDRTDGTHYFAVCCGTGFDAALMAATGSDEKRRWKMAAYIARAFAALPSVTSPLHRVTVAGGATGCGVCGSAAVEWCAWRCSTARRGRCSSTASPGATRRSRRACSRAPSR